MILGVIGIMEKKIGNYRDNRGYIRVILLSIMENQLDKKMDNETEIGIV